MKAWFARLWLRIHRPKLSQIEHALIVIATSAPALAALQLVLDDIKPLIGSVQPATIPLIEAAERLITAAQTVSKIASDAQPILGEPPLSELPSA